MKQINVAVLTPYILMHMSAFSTLQSIGHELRGADDPRQNLHGTSGFQTNLYQVRFIDSFPEGKFSRRGVYELPNDIDLVLAGSTQDGEEEAVALGEQGHIVARFSIFYGGPSDYTGRRPEQSGYSLDIPKSFDVLTDLLQNEAFLDGIDQRNSSLIRDALSSPRNQNPALVTPYLEHALSVNHTSH
jgi:hypothetical protein